MMRHPAHPDAHSPWCGVAFGGGGSQSSESSQQTSNYDQRTAADTGAVAVGPGGSAGSIALYNMSSDPGVVLAALQSVEHISGQAIGTTAGAINDLSKAALSENAALSQDAIDQWASVVNAELARASGAVSGSLNSLAAQSASTSALAAQALGQVSPLQTSLKYIVIAIAAVAIAFFLSRASR